MSLPVSLLFPKVVPRQWGGRCLWACATQHEPSISHARCGHRNVSSPSQQPPVLPLPVNSEPALPYGGSGLWAELCFPGFSILNQVQRSSGLWVSLRRLSIWTKSRLIYSVCSIPPQSQLCQSHGFLRPLSAWKLGRKEILESTTISYYLENILDFFTAILLSLENLCPPGPCILAEPTVFVCIRPRWSAGGTGHSGWAGYFQRRLGCSGQAFQWKHLK
jgi:hypothetical protein